MDFDEAGGLAVDVMGSRVISCISYTDLRTAVAGHTIGADDERHELAYPARRRRVPCLRRVSIKGGILRPPDEAKARDAALIVGLVALCAVGLGPRLARNSRGGRRAGETWELT